MYICVGVWLNEHSVGCSNFLDFFIIFEKKEKEKEKNLNIEHCVHLKKKVFDNEIFTLKLIKLK